MNKCIRRPILAGASVVAVVLALLSSAVMAVAASSIPDFTFIHMTDEHSSDPPGLKSAGELVSLGSVVLEPYKVTALPPAFVVETGDETEFGPTDNSWGKLNAVYANVKIPRYFTMGNHDCTWWSLSMEMRKSYGATCYSFDKFGCHFAILNSAGLQDPRPVLYPEQLDWLERDLKKIGPDTPVFVGFHHPLDISEYAGIYEKDRLMDILRPYNVVDIMVGHGHRADVKHYDGIDMVQGGSGQGPASQGFVPGYQVCSVLNGILRIAYKKQGEAQAKTAMLEKPIAPPAKRYPSITIESPKERKDYAGSVPVKAWVRLGAGEVKSAHVEVDGSKRADLVLKPGGSYEGTITPEGLMPGAHWMKVMFIGQDGSVYHHSTCFYVDTQQPKVLWRVYMGAASKSTPAVSADAVYVGMYDGLVRAYNRKTGAASWEFKTGGAVLCDPLLLADKLYFTSEDGFLYCVSADRGKLAWKFKADDVLYSSPVSDGKSVYFGCANGAFYSVDAFTGKLNWKNTLATYCIELKPYLADGKVYYGAWDCYEYCLNTADGSLKWKRMGQGSAERAAPAYYSPADNGPVVTEGKVFVPDRKFRMAVMDMQTGKQSTFIDNVSGVGLAADGQALYARRTDKTLAKIKPDGTELWSVDVSMDEVPTSPKELNGVVYAVSKRGMLSAVSAADGKVLWQYQVTPTMYVLSSVNGDDSALFVTGIDGSLTAIAR